MSPVSYTHLVLYKEVQTYLETEMPDELPLLRAYTDPSYPLVKCYNLEGAIREARQEPVSYTHLHRPWQRRGYDRIYDCKQNPIRL